MMEDKFIKLGKDLGLEGQSLCDFVRGQLTEERDKENQELERKYNMELLKLEAEKANKVQLPTGLEDVDIFLQNLETRIRGTIKNDHEPTKGSRGLQLDNTSSEPNVNPNTDSETQGRKTNGPGAKCSNTKTISWILWVLVLSGVCVGFGMTVSGLVISYIGRPVATTITERGAPFVWPDITICSTVRFDTDRRSFKGNYDKEVFNFGMRFDYYYALFIKFMGYNVISGPLSSSFAITHLNQEDDTFTKQPFEVIFVCLFKGQKCSYKNFTTHRHPYQPNCFIFRPNNRSAGEPGQDNGLQLILHNGISNKVLRKNVRIFDEFRGFSVSVNNANTLPELNNVINVGTGTKVNIKLTAKQYVRINRPGHPCTMKNPSTVVGFDNIVLSKVDCMEEGIQNDVISQCRCQDPHRYRRPDPKNKTNVPPSCLQVATEAYNVDSKLQNLEEVYDENGKFINISMMNNTDLKPLYDNFLCFYDMYFRNTFPNISCSTYCKDTVYSSVTTSSTPWPDSLFIFLQNMVTIITSIRNETNVTSKDPASIQNLLPAYERELNDIFSNLRLHNLGNDISFSEAETLSSMKNRYALINIFASDDRISSIVEEEIYHFNNLISDIGGNVGLWIGMSVFSSFQLIELVLFTILKVCGNRKNVFKTV